MDKKFLLITYRNQNKKISVQRMSVDTIREFVKDRFNLENPDVKYYDNDVDDWVDLDIEADDFISDIKVAKVKIFEKEVQSESTRQTDDVHIAEEPSRSTCSPSPSRSGSHPQTPESRPVTPVRRPLTPMSPPVTPVASLSPTQSHQQTKKCGSKSWCRLYRVPKTNFSRGVADKLEDEEQLTSCERRNLLEAIYTDVTKFSGGMYPTSEMYQDIVDGLLREYPHLLTVGGLPPSSAREFWKDRIVYKFGNSRKTIDKNHDEVRQKKRKNITERKGNVDVVTFTWGLGKFLPPMPQSEDETSINLHIQWLQREYRKNSADIDHTNVDVKMNLTFPHRRKLIVTEKMAIGEVLETYPWLHSRQQILKEFERLEPNTTSDDIEDLLTIGLQKYRKYVVKLLAGKKMPDFLKEIDETSAYYRTEGQRNYADDCMTIAGLPILFKEKPGKLLKFGDEINESLLLIKTKQKIMSVEENAYEVIVENENVFHCDNFVQAYSGLLACIYVFNLAYPKPLEKAFMFVQNILLGLKD